VTVIPAGTDRFTADDLEELSALVADTWTAAADRDWSAQAGPVEWSCTATADHAVDCVYAPAFFLASRRTDAYPHAGGDLTNERCTRDGGDRQSRPRVPEVVDSERPVGGRLLPASGGSRRSEPREWFLLFMAPRDGANDSQYRKKARPGRSPTPM